MGGRQFARAAENARFSRNISHRQIAIERGRIDRSIEIRVRQQALQFRGKSQLAVGHGIEQRLFARAIARQQQDVRSLIVKRDGEHAVEMRKTIRAPFTIGGQNDFRIRLGTELVPLGHQEASKFEVVVDLAIEDDGERTCRILHGLMAARRKIDDGQPAHREADGFVRRPPGPGSSGPRCCIVSRPASSHAGFVTGDREATPMIPHISFFRSTLRCRRHHMHRPSFWPSSMPCVPMRAPRVPGLARLSARRRSMVVDRTSTSSTGTNRADEASAISRCAGMSLSTTGQPPAIASRTTFGFPSYRLMLINPSATPSHFHQSD